VRHGIEPVGRYRVRLSAKPFALRPRSGQPGTDSLDNPATLELSLMQSTA
jgi:hypothetical protein